MKKTVLIFVVSLFFSSCLYAHTMKKSTGMIKNKIGLNSTTLSAQPDFQQSPYTGYTRAHWLEFTEKIIVGVLPHINAQTGIPELSGDPGDLAYEKLRWLSPGEDGKRALERTMMAVVIYTKATGKDVIPGYNGSFKQVICTVTSLNLK
jgi:hypothetical protein